MDSVSLSSVSSMLHHAFPSISSPERWTEFLSLRDNVSSVSAFSPSDCSWFISPEGTRLLRYAIGVMGNGASLLLYTTPMLTFAGIIEKKTTGEFSCFPYFTALLNCIVYTWYGLPVVSEGWENLPLVTINGFGILLEIFFILIYFRFGSPRQRKVVSLIMLPAAFAFVTAVTVVTLKLHERSHRRAMVAFLGLIFSTTMYGSPLVVMKKVIETKNVEFMPLSLSLSTFLASFLWMVYGLLTCDLLFTSPTFIGTPLGILQLLLYCMYRKRKGVLEEPHKEDVNQNGTHIESQQPLLMDVRGED